MTLSFLETRNPTLPVCALLHYLVGGILNSLDAIIEGMSPLKVVSDDSGPSCHQSPAWKPLRILIVVGIV